MSEKVLTGYSQKDWYRMGLSGEVPEDFAIREVLKEATDPKPRAALPLDNPDYTDRQLERIGLWKLDK